MMRSARAAVKHASLDNIMFVAASAEEIPWQDGFFTQVFDPVGSWADSTKAAREIARVLALG